MEFLTSGEILNLLIFALFANGMQMKSNQQMVKSLNK